MFRKSLSAVDEETIETPDGDRVVNSPAHEQFMSGLPDNIQKLTRDKWESHPHWPSQALLLSSHVNFRATSARVLENVRAAKSPNECGAPSWEYNWWHSAMGGHERYEENKLYVYLNKKYNCNMAHLESTHEEMHEQRDKVMALFDKAIELRDKITDAEGWTDPSIPALPPPPGSKKEPTPDEAKVAAVKEQVRKEFLILKPDLVKAVKDYDMLLRRHLKEEEEVVLPMLLELTPDEWEFYYDSRIDVILEKMNRNSSGSNGKKKKRLPW